MKRQIISLLAGFVLAAGMSVPSAAFAVPNDSEPMNPYGNDSNSTQYYYYDENGYLIEDDWVEEQEPSVLPDTSWFDYQRPLKDYEISTEAQLLGLASLVNENQIMWKPNRFENFEGVTFKLKNDIHLTQPWTPIGADEYRTFKGVFDGNQHTISNMNVNVTGDNAGLFGYLDGKVKNLIVFGSVRATGGNCGSIAGYLGENGTIYRCTTKVMVNAKAKTGGVVGYNHLGTIKRCVNKGNVMGTIKVGGVVGENWGNVVCCGNRGDVTSTVRGITTFGTGGVAGRSVSVNARIDRCFNTGSIVSATEGTGGIVGYTNTKGAVILNSYNTGSISVKKPSSAQTLDLDAAKSYAGGIAGIVGVKGVEIKNCYTCGNILNSQVIGGIVGKYDNASKLKDDPYIINNYYTNQNTKFGIGMDSAGKSKNLSKGTKVTTKGALITGASSLGPFYKIDSNNAYGNAGLPVLSWQKPLSENEIEYLGCIPVKTQKALSEYLIESSKKPQKGDTVKMFFSHYEFTSNAIGDYKYAK